MTGRLRGLRTFMDLTRTGQPDGLRNALNEGRETPLCKWDGVRSEQRDRMGANWVLARRTVGTRCLGKLG
jgi:hypothetical protein